MLQVILHLRIGVDIGRYVIIYEAENDSERTKQARARECQ